MSNIYSCATFIIFNIFKFLGSLYWLFCDDGIYFIYDWQLTQITDASYWETIPHHRLKRSMFTSLTANSPAHCQQLCQGHPTCRSASYYPGSHICELNGKTWGEEANGLSFDEGNVEYYYFCEAKGGCMCDKSLYNISKEILFSVELLIHTYICIYIHIYQLGLCCRHLFYNFSINWRADM